MQKKVDFKERDFFKEPFTGNEIKDILQDRPASEMFSFKSPSFKELGVKPDTLSDQDLVDLMIKEPRLIRRPIVRIGPKVYFGANSKLMTEILK